MPAGLAFLNVKSWHPATFTNQKKVWIAEHKEAEREKREKEAAAILTKELDMIHHEKLMQRKDGSLRILATDAEKHKESGSMAFLYAKPPGIAPDSGPGGPPSGADDEAVQEFFRKNLKKKTSAGFSMNSVTTTLERMTNKRKPQELTIEEQVERFPFLKDAPIEGEFARDVKLKFKPFSIKIQNVKCLRCGEWGHRSGDRECPMKDFNPHDAARQVREDPMTYMKNDLVLEKQKLVLKLAALPREMAINTADSNNQVVLDENAPGAGLIDETYDEVDEEFLSRLSTKEKKALLKRLKMGMSMGGGAEGEGEVEIGEGERPSKRSRKEKKKKHYKKKSSSSSKKDKKKRISGKHHKKESRKRLRSVSSSSSSSSSGEERGGKRKRGRGKVKRDVIM